MENSTSCPPEAGGVAKKEITHALIKEVVTKTLINMGYECPEKDLDKFVHSATSALNRASSSNSSSAASQSSRSQTSRSHSPSKGNKRRKRRASSRSDDKTSSSNNTDSTIVGTDDESDSNKSAQSDKVTKVDSSFTLVKGKNKRAIQKALKKSKLYGSPPFTRMDVDATSAAASTSPNSANSQSEAQGSTIARRPSQPVVDDQDSPRTDCTRLRINYAKAVHTADDGIKIICPDVETFRNLNKYLVENKVQFHTYALEEERKLKVVIRGIPANFSTEDIQTDLRSQGFPVHTVYRLCRRDGSPLWLVLAVLPRTEEARLISKKLRHVCGLSGIQVEAPHKECPRTRKSGVKPSCVNCGQEHTANYRECPKAPKFISHNRPNSNRPKTSTPAINPWGNKKPAQSPKSVPAPPKGADRRAFLAPSPATAIVGPSSFEEDIQTVMAVLRAVSSAEISDFAREFRACRNTEGKLSVSFNSQVGRRKLKNITLLSFNASGLTDNILVLSKCMSEYGVYIALIQETFLKPNRPKACAIAGYVQLRTDRTDARKGGTVLYYSRSLHCCPIAIPSLINMEATGCRLAMTDHRTLVIVSVYLSSSKPLLRSDRRAFLALGDAVIFFGDFNCKNPR
ncbi:hypothetical protein EVAR_61217_1 [Eumeta japonica]|uniref:Uncharacterized protein n=1 Tax=Eumeta variegata TaxID=151549 RepID=A0A4C1Z8Y9_EUMVA|nr:hypothetical protein EVAR_61217_1 [Eumeta japonica]